MSGLPFLKILVSVTSKKSDLEFYSLSRAIQKLHRGNDHDAEIRITIQNQHIKKCKIISYYALLQLIFSNLSFPDDLIIRVLSSSI